MTTYFLTMIVAFGAAMLTQGVRTANASGPNGTDSRPHPATGVLATLTGVVLATVAALRWHVGTDYWNYEALYPEYKGFAWSQFRLFGEPGLRIVAKTGSWVYDDPATMFAIAAVITVGLNVRTIYRHSPMFAFSIVLYVLTMTWAGSFNGVRQYLACAILFAGHQYVLDRKAVKWVAVVALATIFHISAAVMLLLYWLPRRKIGLGRGALLVVAATCASFFYAYAARAIEAIKQDTFSVNSYFTEDVNPLRIAAAFAPLVIYVGFTNRSRFSSADYFYVNVLFLNAIIFLASAGSAYIARFAIYTGVYAVITLPRLVSNMDDRRTAGLIVFVTSVFYALFWYLETTGTTALSNYYWVMDR